LYELLGNPTAKLIEPSGPRVKKNKNDMSKHERNSVSVFKGNVWGFLKTTVRVNSDENDMNKHKKKMVY
jgi:hypothetical protein